MKDEHRAWLTEYIIEMSENKSKVRGRRAQAKESKKEPFDFVPKPETNDEENLEDNKQQPNSVFFGLVDSNELEYFKQAESTLNVNAFDSDEERQGFIRSVLEEARGKELKLVTNQICSKLMERLVLFASDRQLKNIFDQFLGHFIALSQHKYSSHVLETLLVRCSALIEKEILNGIEEIDPEEAEENDEPQVLMESLMIKMFDEFKPQLKTMIDHQYASHVLRLLILITAGKELPSTTVSNSTLRSKKSKIARKMIEIKDNDDFNKAFQIPNSFKTQLKDICVALGKNQEQKKIRELAINKVASPVLQLILQVEGKVDRERSFWHLLFCKDSEDKNPQEEGFVEYLLSDPVGSHLLESCVKNDGVRLKYIERLYNLYMKDRVLKLSRRSNSGVYIIQALLFKLKPAEVEFMLDQIIPELTNLISISENQNLDLAQKVIDASISRNNYRRDELIKQLFTKLAPNYNYRAPELDTSSEFLENVLQLASSTLGNTKDDWPTAEERRRSLFLEKLMEYDFKFVICVWLNFLALPVDRFIQMCFHGVFSHVVQSALVVIPYSEGEPKQTQILRKRLLNVFQNKIVSLACNSYGSHIVDQLWEFTVLLPMYKDKIATELASDSHKVKESTYGRLVWKNWGMELFSRKKYDWKALIKQQDAAYYGETEGGELKRAKKPIELKMEKVAEERRIREEKEGKRQYDDKDGFVQDSKKQKVRGRRRD